MRGDHFRRLQPQKYLAAVHYAALMTPYEGGNSFPEIALP